MLQTFRKAGMAVDPHSKWFRHDTPDVDWLPEVGKKRLVVLMRDQNIGRRRLELDALLNSDVKAFVLTTGELPNQENARIFLKAMPAICAMVANNNFPFIARVSPSGTVTLWKRKGKK